MNVHRHRQLHLWITERDYSLLRELAKARRETLSSVVRRLIKLQRAGSVVGDPEPPCARGHADLGPA